MTQALSTLPPEEEEAAAASKITVPQILVTSIPVFPSGSSAAL
jgi:hypothetical protein